MAGFGNRTIVNQEVHRLTGRGRQWGEVGQRAERGRQGQTEVQQGQRERGEAADSVGNRSIPTHRPMSKPRSAGRPRKQWRLSQRQKEADGDSEAVTDTPKETPRNRDRDSEWVEEKRQREKKATEIQGERHRVF